jgi:hypothetical protein
LGRSPRHCLKSAASTGEICDSKLIYPLKVS